MQSSIKALLASALSRAKVIAPVARHVRSGASARLGAGSAASLNARTPMPALPRTFYKVECFDEDGNLKWVERCENLITTAGATDLLDKYLKGSTYTAAWYVGLYKGTGTLNVADTMSSHSGWTDSSDYSNANRPTWTGGTASAGSVDNSASPAVFNINATATILGAYLVSNNTKGGTTGVLYARQRECAAGRALLRSSHRGRVAERHCRGRRAVHPSDDYPLGRPRHAVRRRHRRNRWPLLWPMDGSDG